MKRRDFLRAAGGGATAATAAAAGTASAAEDGGGGGSGGGGGNQKPDFGGWLEDADGGYKDARGQGEVTVKVGASGNGGNLAFSPAGIWVDSGAKVTWEWTGEGGGHNVKAEEGPASLDSGSPTSAAGTTYTHTFEQGGITNYFCEPHKGMGMKGAVAAGGEVPTEEVSGGPGSKELHELGVPIQAHWVGAATILGIITTIVYSFYVLKYGESPHTGNER